MCLVQGDFCSTTLLSEIIRKAKKSHKCEECYRLISPGERYQYTTMIVEGDFIDTKCCEHCLIGRELIRVKCRGFVYTQIKDDLENHFSVKEWGYRAAKLYVGMKRYWKSFKGDGLLPVPKGLAA